MTLYSIEEARDWPKQPMIVAALLLFFFLPVHAQQNDLAPPKVEVKATFGGAGFGDGADIPHVVVGGSVRIYLTRRLSIEPELLYLRYDATDQDYVFVPNVAFDITDPTKKIVPYVIGGVGALHHQANFGRFGRSSTTWTASGGGGVKIFLTDRLFIAPEGRYGREPTLRGTVSVGYVLSGRR